MPLWPAPQLPSSSQSAAQLCQMGFLHALINGNIWESLEYAGVHLNKRALSPMDCQFSDFDGRAALSSVRLVDLGKV